MGRDLGKARARALGKRAKRRTTRLWVATCLLASLLLGQGFGRAKGPGGCTHADNPPQSPTCVSCGLPWAYSERPVFWQGLLARTNGKGGTPQGGAHPFVGPDLGVAKFGQAKPVGPLVGGAPPLGQGPPQCAREWDTQLSKKQRTALRKQQRSQEQGQEAGAKAPEAQNKEGMDVDSAPVPTKKWSGRA